MKLKLRADAKDLIIFGIFGVVLLYVIALTISNIGTFLREQEFCGLNPFPAFQHNFLLTIALWIIIIVVLFLSVQTNFFERESGIGFEVGAKKEKNYSRWAKKKEIERGLDVVEVDPKADKASAAGIPLIMTKQRVWVDNGGYHNLVIGSTGAGKTQTTVLPMVNLNFSLFFWDIAMYIIWGLWIIGENKKEFFTVLWKTLLSFSSFYFVSLC